MVTSRVFVEPYLPSLQTSAIAASATRPCRGWRRARPVRRTPSRQRHSLVADAHPAGVDLDAQPAVAEAAAARPSHAEQGAQARGLGKTERFGEAVVRAGVEPDHRSSSRARQSIRIAPS